VAVNRGDWEKRIREERGREQYLLKTIPGVAIIGVLYFGGVCFAFSATGTAPTFNVLSLGGVVTLALISSMAPVVVFAMALWELGEVRERIQFLEDHTWDVD
jgi:drug/metabolite transporter (DMT)-like permease